MLALLKPAVEGLADRDDDAVRASVGMLVHEVSECSVDVPWAADLAAGAAVQRFGGVVVDRLDPALPTLAIGAPEAPVGSYVFDVTHYGWVGGVVQSPDSPGGGGIAPAGIVAAALGISEVFQKELGNPRPRPS